MPNSDPTPQYREFEATQINQLMNALTSREQLNQLKTKMDDDCLSVLNRFIDKNAVHVDSYKVLPPAELARHNVRKSWMKWVDGFVGKIVTDALHSGRFSCQICMHPICFGEFGVCGVGYVGHEDHEKEKALVLELLHERGYIASFENLYDDGQHYPTLVLSW